MGDNSIIRTNDKSTRDDMKLSSVISYSILFLFILNLSSGLAEIYSLNIELLSITLKAMLGFIIILRFKIVVSRLTFFSLFIVLCSLLVMILNYLFFPLIRDQFMVYVIDFLTISLPLTIYSLAIRDYKILNDSLIRISKLISVIAIVFFVYTIFAKGLSYNSGRYSMGLSYALLLPAMMLLKNYLDTKSKKSAALSGMLLILILSFGSRGAAICYSVYFFLKLFHKWRFIRKNYLKLFLLGSTLFIVPFGYRPLLRMINNILESMGIYSRTIRAFISDQLILSGRDEIYDTAWQYIKEDPFSIRGINSDIVIIGGYAHNIFLELLFQLGVILGGLFIIVILYRAYRTIFYQRYSHIHEFTLIMFSIAIPSLMVSHSLWNNMYFWIWLFLSVKLYKCSKIYTKEESVALSN